MKSMKLSGPTFVLCLCVLALGQFAASFEPARASRVARANEILWRDPGVIAKRDLYWGMGNAARAPRPPFTFVEESTSGNRPKVEVKDAAGVKWMVKLTPTDPLYNEVNAEIAATRLMWALGYQVDENYFIKSGKIIGAKGLTRAAETIGPDGSFTKARFERRDPEWDEVGFWNIEDSVFKGTKELSGFHAALLLMNSWDVKPANTVILRSKGEKPNELYIMSDLGSTFGSMKGSNNRSRWDLEMYKTTEYVTGVVEGTKFQFHHTLLGNKPIIIPIEHARWFSGLASQLTDPQLRRLFEAAGGTPAEVAGFAAAVRAKIQELQTALAKAK